MEPENAYTESKLLDWRLWKVYFWWIFPRIQKLWTRSEHVMCNLLESTDYGLCSRREVCVYDISSRMQHAQTPTLLSEHSMTGTIKFYDGTYCQYSALRALEI